MKEGSKRVHSLERVTKKDFLRQWYRGRIVNGGTHLSREQSCRREPKV